MENSKGSILIIDDTLSNLKILSKILTENGYLVRAAKTAGEGLTSIYNKLPDLILLDVKLPDIIGYEVCKQIKSVEATKDIPVMFISSSIDVFNIVKGFEAGGVDYITKPFYIEELLARVNTHIDMSRTKELNEKLKKINEELKEAKEAAEKANKAKTELIGNVSHELKTPMNGIMGFTELLRETEKDKANLEIIDSIFLSSKHLLNLINDILNLSKIEAGKLDVSSEKFDFDVFLKNIDSLFSRQAQLHNLDFFSEYENTLPKILIGDEVLILQILNNLVGNSIKFTKKGYVKIIINKSVFTDNKCIAENTIVVEFTVIDTGIGINENKQKRLYEPFEQGEYYLTKQYSGTGLGLSIVKKLVDLMNGEIEMKTEIGSGTQFKVRLPLKIAEKTE